MRRALRLRPLLLGCFLALGAAPAGAGLRVEAGRFLDDGGAAVILRGVNVAADAKVPSFDPIDDPALFDPLPGWGVNVVRLVFVWEAYEPAPGVYDDAYLDAYASAVQGASARGIAVIVDFHQDGFSRFSIGGCGDGFPAWTIPFWIPTDTPDNGPGCAGWATAMALDLEMHLSWQAFHADATGARSAYLAMVARVAGRLAGEEGVIGYDLLNEPWGDEPAEIAPLYADAAAAIRAQHADAILFVSPHAATSIGAPSNLPRPAFDNFVYSPHFYDPSVHQLHVWLGAPLDFPFWLMASQAADWGVPLFVGEFGAAASTLGVTGYLDSVHEQLDLHLASAAQWSFTPGWTPTALDGWNGEDLSIVDDGGALRPNFRVRSYAQRISGSPTELRVEDASAPRNNSVELAWEHDPATGSTILFVPRAVVFGAAPVTISTVGEDVTCAWDTGEIRVTCSSGSSGSKRVRLFVPGGTCGLVGPEWGLLLSAIRIARRRVGHGRSNRRSNR